LTLGTARKQPTVDAGVLTVEGLNLTAISPGCYELCLPLKIFGGDGAPARGMLKGSDADAFARGLVDS